MNNIIQRTNKLLEKLNSAIVNMEKAGQSLYVNK